MPLFGARDIFRKHLTEAIKETETPGRAKASRALALISWQPAARESRAHQRPS